MIISHRYRFIFIKTRKTAGTSIEIGLSKFCDGDDVVTELGEKPEIKEQYGHTGARNFRVPVSHWTARDVVKFPLRGAPVFHSHSPATFVRDRVPARIWRDYYTIAFERNPFDRIVSQYYWNTRETREPFQTYLEHARRYRLSNWEMYADGDEIIVDHVARFENLNDELEAFARQVGLPRPVELARAKTEYRPKTHADDMLDAAAKDRIAEVCAREMAAFGYARPD